MKNAIQAIESMRKNCGQPYRKVAQSTDRLALVLFQLDMVEQDRMYDKANGISY